MAEATVAADRPSVGRIWWLAIRPNTLPAAIAPVLVGLGLAIGSGVFSPLPAAACLAVALLLQVAANLANDLADFRSGADTDGLAGLQELAGYATALFYRTDEEHEGKDAFLEKRKPDFTKFPKRP